MSKFAKKIDNNHTQISNELKSLGFSVYSTHFVGHGFPDLLINWHGINYIVEIKKDEKAGLTSSEIEFNSAFFVIIGSTTESIVRDILVYEYFLRKK